ncbi:hypothetical protein ACE7GA_25560 [Roseomonas sp. CCTCC AB2023176]|uniref:hypothetical protein n=1 Tax=Roseomonas sp. CCTCC AB2023176 TaxID=3342640 RepID=UPI0035DB6338
MTRPGPAATPPDDGAARRAEEARVTAFLSTHPTFLADHPDLYRTLTPPLRVHGDRLADHMAAMLVLARAETGTVAEAAGAARDLTLRAAGAAVSLIGAPDPLAVVAHEWPALLGLDHAILAAEGPPDVNRRDLPPGTVARLLGTRELLLRNDPLADAGLLHGEAAGLIRRDALVRLPGASLSAPGASLSAPGASLSAPGGGVSVPEAGGPTRGSRLGAHTTPRLLVLGARDPSCLPTIGASSALRLLATALARALEP